MDGFVIISCPLRSSVIVGLANMVENSGNVY